MKVKVGNIIYDGIDEPIMVILTNLDKASIRDMPDDNFCYCQYCANNWSEKDIEEWMKIPDQDISQI